jgi:uncharacterized Zn-finger protein
MEGEEHFLVDGREVVIVPDTYVRCDGGVGVLGHPREYMTLQRGGMVICKYCGRRYLHQSHPEAAQVRSTGERVAA